MDLNYFVNPVTSYILQVKGFLESVIVHLKSGIVILESVIVHLNYLIKPAASCCIVSKGSLKLGGLGALVEKKHNQC